MYRLIIISDGSSENVRQQTDTTRNLRCPSTHKSLRQKNMFFFVEKIGQERVFHETKGQNIKSSKKRKRKIIINFNDETEKTIKIFLMMK